MSYFIPRTDHTSYAGLRLSTIQSGAPVDHRTSVRFAVCFPALITRARREGAGRVSNLSVWGCSLQSARPLRKGDRLAVQLWIPAQDAPVHVDLARVRWANPTRCGVEFLAMPRESRARLRQLLISLTASKYRRSGVLPARELRP